MSLQAVQSTTGVKPLASKLGLVRGLMWGSALGREGAVHQAIDSLEQCAEVSEALRFYLVDYAVQGEVDDAEPGTAVLRRAEATHVRLSQKETLTPKEKQRLSDCESLLDNWREDLRISIHEDWGHADYACMIRNCSVLAGKIYDSGREEFFSLVG